MGDEFFRRSHRIFIAFCVGHRDFHQVMLLSNFYPLGAKKNMIFTGVG